MPRQPASRVLGPSSRRKSKVAKSTRRARFALGDFWSLIARVEREGRGDLSKSIATFEEELRALDDASLVAADGIFCDLMRRAHCWPLWDAAYLIHGGCSDDGFWDFRAGLIALGKQRYERAMKDPDSLAAIDDIVDRTLFEGFQYVTGRVCEDRGVKRLNRSHHAKPVQGKACPEEEIPERLPKLAARFED